MVVLAAVVSWTMAPLATGAITPETATTRVDVEVPVTTTVTPGWQIGDDTVTLPKLTIPGETNDITSAGWRTSTNWVEGYEIRIRATTDPALRGSNAVDGSGARSFFADYKASGCPCPWSLTGYTHGVFGYSASVTAVSGSAAEASKWGTAKARKWRGFTEDPYLVYSTPGGSGLYAMTVLMRSEIPDGAVQAEGSYRAGLIVSAHPRL